MPHKLGVDPGIVIRIECNLLVFVSVKTATQIYPPMQQSLLQWKGVIEIQ